jgi:cupin 2 domain-containing protein
MPIATGNLFANLPPAGPHEHVDELAAAAHLRIERIVSHGQASPPDFWYDQDRAEWVVVLTGSAGPRFEGEDAARPFQRGDYVLIPAHARHRVEWTDGNEPTVWLAVRDQ